MPYVHFMPAPSYKISKAAMNALTVQYALDHAKEGFSFMALCPGVRPPLFSYSSCRVNERWLMNSFSLV